MTRLGWAKSLHFWKESRGWRCGLPSSSLSPSKTGQEATTRSRGWIWISSEVCRDCAQSLSFVFRASHQKTCKKWYLVYIGSVGRSSSFHSRKFHQTVYLTTGLFPRLTWSTSPPALNSKKSFINRNLLQVNFPPDEWVNMLMNCSPQLGPLRPNIIRGVILAHPSWFISREKNLSFRGSAHSTIPASAYGLSYWIPSIQLCKFHVLLSHSLFHSLPLYLKLRR